MKFMNRTTKYTQKYYKPNQDILSELKINPVANKIQNSINKWAQEFRRIDRGRPATLNYEISTV